MGYYGLTEMDCIIILLVHPIGYGLYINLKKAFANLSIIPFLIIYLLTRSVAGFIIYAICDFPSVDTGVSGWDEVLYLFLIFLAGATIGPIEYMLFSSAQHLRTSTVSSMLNSQYIVGVVIFYIMSPDSVNGVYLVMGLLLATVGSVAIIGSEFISEVNNVESLFSHVEEEVEPLLKSAPALQERKITAFWMFVALLGSLGILLCNTLIVSEETFTDGVSDPGIISVMFLSGSSVGLLVVLVVFGWLDVLHEDLYRDSSVFRVAYDELQTAPGTVLIWTVAIGLLTSCADAAVFVAFSELPYSISYAIGMSEVVVGAGTAVLFFGDYKHLTSYFAPSFVLVFLGTVFFVAAIYIYLTYAFNA